MSRAPCTTWPTGKSQEPNELTNVSLTQLTHITEVVRVASNKLSQLTQLLTHFACFVSSGDQNVDFGHFTLSPLLGSATHQQRHRNN